MTKPTLFLDIDGVLHPADAPWLDNGKPAGKDLFRWLPKLLKALSFHPNTQIVLHSTWRYIWATDEELRSYLPKELSDLIVATTGREIKDRYASIVAYKEKHGITDYVILDDDGNAFPYRSLDVVYCKPSQGLSNQTTYGKLINKLRDINESAKAKSG